MGLFDTSVPYKGQKYSELKKSCASTGSLFTDQEFPPTGESLCYNRQNIPKDVVWKRPGEISRDPHFFVDGASANDFHQGEIGNCWFVAACASIAETPSLLKKIVPDVKEQEWHPDNKYSGIFHFRFWRCGEWVDVVIDDFLPTRNGRLIYVHSKDKNEFWSPLLEKAYAKLFGNYESLIAGNTRDALVDMSGGVGENLDTEDYKSEQEKMELFRILKNSYENKSLMSASINAGRNEMEDKLSCGLVKGHAYSVTAVKDIKLGTGLFSIFNRDKIHMIRCRNPWGDTEWNGAWSDGYVTSTIAGTMCGGGIECLNDSDSYAGRCSMLLVGSPKPDRSTEWNKVSSSQKEDLGLTFDDNGEFWMSFEDFCQYYTTVSICHMINTSFFSFKKTWREGKSVGEWKNPDRCGGCGNHSSFLRNPQFVFDIKDKEDEVLVSLEQWDRRTEKDKGATQHTIGCTIIKTDLNREYRMHDSMERMTSGPFVSSRSTLSRAMLTQGRYCVVPSTFDPGSAGQFILRLYCSSDPNLSELTLEEPPIPSSCLGLRCCGPCSLYRAVTQISIVRAEGLEAQDFNRTSDPYVVVQWEGKKVKTPYIGNNLNPEWNTRVTCFQKKPSKDIIVEVWNDNILKDSFMGRCIVAMSQRNSYKGGNTMKGYNLMGRDKEAAIKKKGRLWLQIKYTTELDEI